MACKITKLPVSWQTSFVCQPLQLRPAFSLSVGRCMSLSHFTLKREQPAWYICQLLNVGLYRKYQSKLCTLALMLFWEATLKAGWLHACCCRDTSFSSGAPFFFTQPAFPKRSSASDSLHFKRSLWGGLWGPQQRAPAGQAETKGRVKDGGRWRERQQG